MKAIIFEYITIFFGVLAFCSLINGNWFALVYLGALALLYFALKSERKKDENWKEILKKRRE